MKNIDIEFWRFAFAIYMVVYHTAGHVYGIRTGGYIGVDVFFIISGYFLANSQNKLLSENNYTYLNACGYNYLTNRYKRLWPMYIVAYVISAVVGSIVHFHSITKGLERVYLSFPEMFMLRITTSVNSVSWFIAAMLLTGLILYVLLNFDKNDILKSSILPLMSLYIYSCFNESIGRIHVHISHFVFSWIYDGILRAFAGLSVGIFASFLVNRLQLIKFKVKIKNVFWYLGNIGFLSIVIVSFYKFSGFCDFIYIFIAFVSLILLLISKNKALASPPPKTKLFDFITKPYIDKVLCYLGGLAYPIYLMHETVFRILKKYHVIKDPIIGCIVVIIITVIEAVIFTSVLEKALKYLEKIFKKTIILKGEK